MNDSIYKSDNILTIEDLSISFPIVKYPCTSLRDKFVQLLKSPKEFFFPDTSSLNLVQNLNLKINSGERVGLLGVNGTGKTSLCRYIAGMYGKRNGILVNGEVKAIFSTEIAVEPELTGRENTKLLTMLLYPDLNTIERTNIVDESLEFSELGKFIDTPFKYYSKGMRTRLFLSLISSRPSDLLILDEVFDGADLFFSDKITKRVEEMIIKCGAVIFVSHSLDQIKRVCNRVIVLNGQGLGFDGPTEEGISYYLENCGPS